MNCELKTNTTHKAMMKQHNPFKALTKFEIILWAVSAIVVGASAVIGTEFDPLALTASLIGVTALIFVAKGDVFGQGLTVIFSLLYAIVSYGKAYYGEMITYLFMSAPAAIAAIISWLKHPYNDDGSEVKVHKVKRGELALIVLLTAVVTTLFYFVLRTISCAELAVSTVSVTTSFFASCLVFFRSPYYGLAYAANDIVLIVLWIIAALHDPSKLPMIACFIMFLANDLYGFFNWRQMQKRQKKENTR